MYELLIRIETLCLDAAGAGPWVAGVALLVVGILLWLAGSRFSTAIIAAGGAGAGAAAGLAAAAWMSLGPMVGLLIGAAVGCLLGVIFKKALFFVMAVAVFALAAGGTYSSRLLQAPPPATPEAPSIWRVAPTAFSAMDPDERRAYVDDLSGQAEGFRARLQTLIDDALAAIRPHWWKVLIAVVLGGILGVALIWLIENVVPLVCYSAVGALLILAGLACTLAAAGRPLGGPLHGHDRAVNIVYGVMVLFGVIVQRAAERRGQRPHPIAPLPRKSKVHADKKHQDR